MRRLALLLLCALVTEARAEGPPPQRASQSGAAPPTSWVGATPLRLARSSRACLADRLGEWARITCRLPEWIIDVHFFGAPSEGVVFREAKPDGVALFLRLRPGDRREIAISESVSGGYAIEEGARVIVSELWLPGEAEPTITIAAPP